MERNKRNLNFEVRADLLAYLLAVTHGLKTNCPLVGKAPIGFFVAEQCQAYTFSILANTPIVALDTSQVSLNVSDSIPMSYTFVLDTLKNKVDFDFEVEPNQKYSFSLMPGAITDFFGMQNDTLDYNLSTGSFADYGNLRMILGGDVTYPIVVQLTNEKGVVQREIVASEAQTFEFNHLNPGNYIARVIFDSNGNGKWDTGNYLKKQQPEKISYYPGTIEIRANWEK